MTKKTLLLTAALVAPPVLLATHMTSRVILGGAECLVRGELSLKRKLD